MIRRTRMRITNATLSLSKSRSGSWLERIGSALATHVTTARYPLRAAIVTITDDAAVIEVTFVELESGDGYEERFYEIELLAPH